MILELRILYFEDLSVGMTEQEWVHNAAQNGRSLAPPDYMLYLSVY